MFTRSNTSGGAEPEAQTTPSKMEQILLDRVAQLEEMQAQSRPTLLLQPSPQATQLMGGQIGSLSGHAASFNTGTRGGLLTPTQILRCATGTTAQRGRLLQSSDTCRRQIDMLNKLFKRLAEAEQKEHELSEKESIVMFAEAASILAPNSASTSPGNIGDVTPAPGQRNGTDEAEDEDEHLNVSGSPFTMSSSNKEVRAVQSALASMTRMKKSILRQIRQYISHEYKLHVCEKEETSQMETKVKFHIPPGVGNKPSMKQGRTFRQAIERHMMTYPVTNCALTPILTEILGKNAGEQDKNTDILTKIRWTPPNMRSSEYLENSTTKHFDEEFNRQNENLYKLFKSHQDTEVRSYLGLRSNAGIGSNTVVTEGREKDGLSIVAAILYYHEQCSFHELCDLKMRVAESYKQFATTKPVEKCICDLRRLLEKAKMLQCKLPWQVITDIGSTLIQKSSLYTVFLSAFLEPTVGANPDDCLKELLTFLALVEQTSQKVRLTNVDLNRRAPTHIYKTDSVFDINALERGTRKTYPSKQARQPGKQGQRQDYKAKTSFKARPRGNDKPKWHKDRGKTPYKNNYPQNREGGRGNTHHGAQRKHPDPRPKYNKARGESGRRPQSYARATKNQATPAGDTEPTIKLRHVKTMFNDIKKAVESKDNTRQPSGMQQYMQNTLGLANQPCYSTRTEDIKKQMQQNKTAQTEKREQTRTRAASKKSLQKERTMQRHEKKLLHKATTPWQRGRSLRNKTTHVVSDKPSCQQAEIKRSQCHWKAKPNITMGTQGRQGGPNSSAAAKRSRHSHMRARAEAGGAWPRGQATTPARHTDTKPPIGAKTPMPNEYGDTPTPDTGARVPRQQSERPAQEGPTKFKDAEANYQAAVKKMTMSLQGSTSSMRSMTATDNGAGINLHTICEMDGGLKVLASTSTHDGKIAITVEDNKAGDGGTQLAAASKAAERASDAEREVVEYAGQPAEQQDAQGVDMACRESLQSETKQDKDAKTQSKFTKELTMGEKAGSARHAERATGRWQTCSSELFARTIAGDSAPRQPTSRCGTQSQEHEICDTKRSVKALERSDAARTSTLSDKSEKLKPAAEFEVGFRIQITSKDKNSNKSKSNSRTAGTDDGSNRWGAYRTMEGAIGAMYEHGKIGAPRLLRSNSGLPQLRSGTPTCGNLAARGVMKPTEESNAKVDTHATCTKESKAKLDIGAHATKVEVQGYYPSTLYKIPKKADKILEKERTLTMDPYDGYTQQVSHQWTRRQQATKVWKDKQRMQRKSQVSRHKGKEKFIHNSKTNRTHGRRTSKPNSHEYRKERPHRAPTKFRVKHNNFRKNKGKYTGKPYHKVPYKKSPGQHDFTKDIDELENIVAEVVRIIHVDDAKNDKNENQIGAMPARYHHERSKNSKSDYKGLRRKTSQDLTLPISHPLVDFQMGAKRSDRGQSNGTNQGYESPDFTIVPIMVDTGCASTLLKTNTEGFLSDRVQSPVLVSGFQGNEKVRGGVRGTGHLYVLDAEGLGQQTGGYLRHQVDTLKSLNENLLSLSAIYGREDYAVELPAKSSGKPCAFTKIGGSGVTKTLPMSWNGQKGAFMMHVLMAHSKKAAEKWGKIAETFMQQRTNVERKQIRNHKNVGINKACRTTRTATHPSQWATTPSISAPVYVTSKTIKKTEHGLHHDQSAIRVSYATYVDPLKTDDDGKEACVKPITYHKTRYQASGAQVGNKCRCEFNQCFLMLPTGFMGDSNKKRDGIDQWDDQMYVIEEQSSRKTALDECEQCHACTENMRALATRTAHMDIHTEDHVWTTAASPEGETSDDDQFSSADEGQNEPHTANNANGNEPVDIDSFRDRDYERNDADIKGAKAGMKSSKFRKMSEYELHKRRGHLGYYPNCLVCRMIRGSHRKIATKHAPFIETRTGYSWVGDTITWSHPSRYGNKYTIVLRDIASGFFACLHIKARSESTQAIEDWVVAARRNPLFSKLGHPIIQSLRLDPAGEWNYKNVKFMEMTKNIGITIMWSSPDDKRSNAHAENSCKQIEVVAKSILLEQNLPYIFIEDAVDQGVMLRNLFPLARNINSSDGDAIRPLEEITSGQISRRQCDNRLHHMVTLGSPCIVHSPKVKGSRIDRTKSRWGIALGVIGDVPIFFDPYDKSMARTFTSKNYHEFTMPDGYNFYQLLGLQEPDLIRDANGNPIFPRPHKRDTKLRTIVDIGKFIGKGAESANASTQDVLDRTETESKYDAPTVTLVDEFGNIYDQYDGQLRPNGKQIQDAILREESPASQVLKNKRRLIEAINHHPRSLIGKNVHKFFEGHGLCVGRIEAYAKDVKYWKIRWDSDSTIEEWDKQDMVTYLVEEKDIHLRNMGSHYDPINLPSDETSDDDLADDIEDNITVKATCDLPDCSEECWVEPDGHVHDYCCGTHSRQDTKARRERIRKAKESVVFETTPTSSPGRTRQAPIELAERASLGGDESDIVSPPREPSPMALDGPIDLTQRSDTPWIGDGPGLYKGEPLEPWEDWKNKKVSLIMNKIKRHGYSVPKGADRANGKLQKFWNKVRRIGHQSLPTNHDESWKEPCEREDDSDWDFWGINADTEDENSEEAQLGVDGKALMVSIPREIKEIPAERTAPNDINFNQLHHTDKQLMRGREAMQKKTKEKVLHQQLQRSKGNMENPTHPTLQRTERSALAIMDDKMTGQLRRPPTPYGRKTQRKMIPHDYSYGPNHYPNDENRSYYENACEGPTKGRKKVQLKPKAKIIQGYKASGVQQEEVTEPEPNNTPMQSANERIAQLETAHDAAQRNHTYDLKELQAGMVSKPDIDESHSKLNASLHVQDAASADKDDTEFQMPTYLTDTSKLAFYMTPAYVKITWLDVCRNMGITKEADQKTYYYWLGETYGENGINKGPWSLMDNPHSPIYGVKFANPWGVKASPQASKAKLIGFNQAFPRPIGAEWERLILLNQSRSTIQETKDENEAIAQKQFEQVQSMNAYLTKIGRTVTEIPDKIDAQQSYMAYNGMHEMDCKAYRSNNDNESETRQDLIRRFFQSEDKPSTINGGIIHPLTGKIIAPIDFQKIFTREDREKWMEAVVKELDAFDKRCAIQHDLTLSEIREMGITHSPVPMRLIFDVKYLPDGTLQKFKARQVVQGHKKYMRYGEHFHTTFAPAPTLATNRLLQAIITHKKLHRVVFDINTAYLWAPAPLHERIPLRYPVGLRRYHPKTGEELMGVLKKMIYGCPQSAFRWAEFRQKWMEQHFKHVLKWGYHQARQDPCLTILTSPKGVQSYVVSHVDDIEIAGADLSVLKFIEEQYRQEFEITSGNPRFMLGIQRDMEEVKPNVPSIHLTQPDFLEETYKIYQDKMKKTVPTTPMPVGEFLYMGQDASSEQEHKHYLAQGFQNIAGACLWGARNCFPECMYGTAQVCRLMSKPNKRAWDCACRILSYMYHKRKQGIRYRADGCNYLQCYYDSSHKADPTDGKAQYGWVITLMNGPIEWNSKKHNHVGISSSHNEYMALSHATKAIMWIRQLLQEMNLEEYIPEATPMMGDNDQATLLSQQEMVTNGNKFYLLDYHYSREAVKEGHTSTRRVDTKSNYSDMFTKAVPAIDITRLGEVVKGNADLHQETPPKSIE